MLPFVVTPMLCYEHWDVYFKSQTQDKFDLAAEVTLFSFLASVSTSAVLWIVNSFSLDQSNYALAALFTLIMVLGLRMMMRSPRLRAQGKNDD
jgi:hypothetical protein